MKKLFVLLITVVAFACNGPVQITGNPDNRAATSGTLGSVKASDAIPANSGDTSKIKNTLPSDTLR